MNEEVTFADLFAGGGGTSTGAFMVPNLKVLWALNHDHKAIQTHAANHPETKHYQADIRTQNVLELDPVNVLWGSLECQEHSKAKGGKKKNIGSFILGWELHRYIIHCNPDTLMVENVPEFVKWGKLKKGKSHIVFNNGPGGSGYDYKLKDYKISWTDMSIVDMSKMLIPNKFYYACPDGMIRKDEVPEYAGLFYYKDPKDMMSFVGLTQIKAAKFIHKRPQNYSGVLLDKFYYRCLDLEGKLSEMKQTLNRFQDIYQVPELGEGVDSSYFQQKLFD